ncbi:multiple epidermal growth factor-like domains protein 6 [Liolophura sinensis]|uniref:multiple epidermal growth factor-like domains protein 6 n=1 Tax=Liolophura sinensis TaxID=3198878 RepID=UPI00315964D3
MVRYPDGLLCICNEGYIASTNLAVCEKATNINGVCMTECAGLFTVCNAVSGRCACLPEYVSAADNQNCVLPRRGLLGEACGDGCALDTEQECVNGVCRCMSNLRRMTTEEIRAFNNPQRQCISWTYTLDGSSPPTTTPTTMAPPSTITAAPTVSTPTPQPTTTTTAPFRAVLSSCSSNNQCPAQASCRVRYPDGLLCICNEGFVASTNLAGCERAAYINDVCITQCAGLFMVCNALLRRCECLPGYVMAGDNQNCVLPRRGLLGEACGDGCVFVTEQECVNGVCTCMSNLRRMTTAEIQAFNNPQRQCISWIYTLDGSSPPTTTTMAPPPTTTAAPTVSSPTPQRTTTTIAPFRAVLSSCSSNSQCPGQASCRVRYPDGLLCVCNEGFVASTNLAGCERAAYINDVCITQCAGLFMVCNALLRRCECLPGYVMAGDNQNCVLPRRGLLGEACGDGCVFVTEQECVNGVCTCMSNLRRMTTAEIQAFNNPQRQCISWIYTLDGSSPPTTTTMAPPPTTTAAPTVSSPTAQRTTTTIAPFRAVLSSCSSNSQCPGQASCRVRYPDGLLCICNEGFVASTNLAGCERAAYINDVCITQCAGLFMVCNALLRRCECLPGYVMAGDNQNCVLPRRGLLGEACGDGCVFVTEQECVNGVCTCMSNLRRMTTAEIQAFNNPQRQCISWIYTLDGSSPPTTTTMAPPPTTTAAPTVSSPTAQPTTTTIAPFRAVLSSCSSNSQCPAQASCRVRYPDGLLCICNEGFVASTNLAGCERAAYINDVCITQCAGLFMVCSALSRRCECLSGYVMAGDNQNCVLPRRGLLGEACGDGCVFVTEQECVNGVCTCMSNLRRMTTAEIQAFNNPQRQCISSTYTLDGLLSTTTVATILPSIQTTKESAAGTISVTFACQVDSQCPDNASCRLRYPTAQICYCDRDYVSSTNLAACEQAAYVNEICITRCYGWNTMCDASTKRCVCLPGYSLSTGGKSCVLPGRALLDEPCRDGCLFEKEQMCVEGTCRCRSGLRQMTDEEIRAFNNPNQQCIDESFSFALIRLYFSCSSDGQCPIHASCKYRFPGGQVCYCDAGYVSSLDGLRCEPIARLSEACITRCGGFFTTCDSRTRLCTCLPGYIPSADGMNCARTGLPLLGELCLTSCLLSDEQRCVNGRCECLETMRPATDEERQAFNNETFQCRPISYSLVPLYSPCSCGCQCPINASCKSRYPDGMVCYCDAGYVSSLDGSSCEPVARLSEACITRCGGFFTTCDSRTRLCTCLPGYIPSADGMNCVRTGLPLLGGVCLTSCLLSDEQRCVNGRCECLETMRPATIEERQAFSNRNFQCLPTGYALGGIRLFQTCTYDSQCPCHASCLERSTDGKICYCNSGYMASQDHYTCLPASYYGQVCVSRCAGLFMTCDVATRRCVCNTGYSVAADGRNCVIFESALLGGSCKFITQCYFAQEQVCVNDTCVCRSGLRPSTFEEIRAFDNESPQCRSVSYALRTLALFASCTYDGQCPTGAQCLERRPNGRICYCSFGYMASPDGLTCLQVAYYGQVCVSRCAGLYMTCDPDTQRCVCVAGSQPTTDGRNCVPDGFALLGGSCVTNRCLFGSEQECVNGKCTCISGLRPTLEQEIRAFNNELPQCRMDNYYLVTTALFAACSHDSECPYHASCLERRPDGKICYPDAGYMSTVDGLSCIRAAYYGQNCVSKCAGLFMTCDVTRRVCVCNTGCSLAADGRNCVPDGSALLGGVCLVKSCYYRNEQECVSGTCTCRNSLRPTTPEEIRAFNGEVPQCRAIGYYLTIRQLFTSCTSDDQCPLQASCLERRPNGRICYCNNGYMASTDRYQCIQEAYYGQLCESRCAGLYMHCDTTRGICVCNAGSNLANDRRNCVPVGSALLGGSCNVNSCLFATTQVCVNGTCACRSGMRATTDEEIRAFNNQLPQCRINTYYLRTTVLFTACSYDSQCPYHASCLERRSDGKICYPDPGYISSLDGLSSIRAAYFGQNCVSRCAGLFMTCHAVTLRCVCNSGCSLAADGRNCVPDGSALLGGSCSVNTCLYRDRQECVNGRCTCKAGLRATTLEEIRAFNNELPQCRPSSYYLRSTRLFRLAYRTLNVPMVHPVWKDVLMERSVIVTLD